MSEITLTDIVLIDRVTTGDRDAIGLLYERYSSSMLALALRMLKSRGEAEDVLQDVFIEIWNRAGDFDPRRSKVKSWMFLRLRSRCLDRLKSPRLARASRLTTDHSAAIEDKQAFGEKLLGQTQLRSALSKLPDKLRDILQMGYFEGLSSREIGERLGLPTGTVKSRAAKALRELRGEMKTNAKGEGAL
jgi:RNA polymerase sigma-70 factor (ECF subfamily)